MSERDGHRCNRRLDLFVPVVEKTRWHPNFVNAASPIRAAEQALLQQWADGFIDRDGKFVEEFQTTFNSAFWEIYLHALFKEYRLTVDWSHSSPDFSLGQANHRFIVEAVTANAAAGKPNEWDRHFTAEELAAISFTQLNTEAIIRLSNAVISKSRKYENSYRWLPHVNGKPFVIAVAPFEQPHFSLQYDRPIRALLYDYYVDEDIYLRSPDRYREGPPVSHLGSVTKDNGAEVPLGLFNDDYMDHISAILFSCTATWGKVSVLAKNAALEHSYVNSVWATAPRGAAEKRQSRVHDHIESLADGIQIYHNPYARYPLSTDIFRAPRVVQHYIDPTSGDWVYEGRTDALQHRQVYFLRPPSSSP